MGAFIAVESTTGGCFVIRGLQEVQTAGKCFSILTPAFSLLNTVFDGWWSASNMASFIWLYFVLFLFVCFFNIPIRTDRRQLFFYTNTFTRLSQLIPLPTDLALYSVFLRHHARNPLHTSLINLTSYEKL